MVKTNEQYNLTELAGQDIRTYSKSGVSSSKEIFVVKQTIVFQIKPKVSACGKNHHRR